LKEKWRGSCFKKDQNGETVITKLDKETLIKIAEVGKGVYIDGTTTATALSS
jgi:Ca-activated chloride channel family protein